MTAMEFCPLVLVWGSVAVTPPIVAEAIGSLLPDVLKRQVTTMYLPAAASPRLAPDMVTEGSPAPVFVPAAVTELAITYQPGTYR